MEPNTSHAIFHGTFFEKFLSVTHYQTLVAILALLVCFWIVKQLQNRKVSFSLRMLAALVIGAVLGLGIQAIEAFPDQPTLWMNEAAAWYGLFGRAFIAFIRMLVIPLIFVSIVKVILDFAGKEELPKIAFRGIFWLLFTTAIAAVVGILLADLFKLGNHLVDGHSPAAQAKEYTNIIDTFIRLIPNNIISAMAGDNIVGLVIFSALLG
ncbi:MAG: cation:dicarboxylate symporter family transporter, partial [Enterobacteriaceae bacterium]